MRVYNDRTERKVLMFLRAFNAVNDAGLGWAAAVVWWEAASATMDREGYDVEVPE